MEELKEFLVIIVSTGMLAFAGGVIGMRIVTKRKRRQKADGGEKAAPVVREEFPPVAPEGIGTDYPLPSRSPQPSLDDALTRAVYRAIADRRAGLELRIGFPEKCRIFGEVVPASGAITIGGAEEERTRELEARLEAVEGRLGRLSSVEEDADAEEEGPLF